MSFNFVERTPLQLSMLSILGCLGVSAAYAADVKSTFPPKAVASTTVEASPSPASAKACVGLDSNADRLACYDALFKTPIDTNNMLAAQAAAPLAPEKSQLQKLFLKKFRKRLGMYFL